MTAVMSAIPVIAAVLTFVTYSLSGHQLNVATIFTVGPLTPFVSVLEDSLTLFITSAGAPSEHSRNFRNLRA